MICWLAKLDGAGPCDGRLIRAHLIPQRLLKREFPDGAWLAAHSEQWIADAPVEADDDWAHRTLREILRDSRSWVAACGGISGLGGHHGMLDSSRRLRIPRDRIPQGTEDLAAELGLVWFLDRTYGARSDL